MDQASSNQKQLRTLRLRVKDKHAAELSRQARAVNYVWNYINELSERSIRELGCFLSVFDLHSYTTGASKELGLHSHTVQKVAGSYVQARIQFRKRKLAWRRSGGVRRSLGWVPFNTGHARWRNGQVHFNGTAYGVWDSYGLAGYTLRSGSFSEDSRGRWYFNVAVEVPIRKSTGKIAMGIDLGCKDAATTSEADVLHGRWYRADEKALATAQRARKKRQTKKIHARIKNRRSNGIHQFSTRIVEKSAAVFVGNVSSKAMVKTTMAKSALDAGWSSLKRALEYKCASAGVIYQEVNEAYSTRTCSECGALSGPKGLKELGIRQWSCVECGSSHDRDINAARNIAALGIQSLAEGAYE
ncbi:RNA-guided endonuclease InsQ/TnpB family protein [Granulosicoccus antarcticus]|uniref:Transposase n=1 Tax=Granulosicoccus antarcticus IMCC3135 TaxID=1192854 RepID=A0A2Z2NPD8_9GAMM|nr:RNA-guided endonuclease TnpB family protein [Granulosicoccus antarcticus]ASJ73306.1 hypothetical protein IMCC3135_16120 [Granulosicoccus antarcticus IMCC3135]